MIQSRVGTPVERCSMNQDLDDKNLINGLGVVVRVGSWRKIKKNGNPNGNPYYLSIC